MPCRSSGSLSTSKLLNFTPKSVRICTTAAENPHCGNTGVPYMNSTASLELISLADIGMAVPSIGRRQFLGAQVRGKPGFMRAQQCSDRHCAHSRNVKLIAASGSKKDSRYSGASGLVEDTIGLVSGHAKEIAAL